MMLSMTELALARETTTELLNELGLDAYLFEVEPHDEVWELKVDCAMATNGAWESFTLIMSRETLLMSHDNAAIHQSVLSDLRGHLAACKLRVGKR